MHLPAETSPQTEIVLKSTLPPVGVTLRRSPEKPYSYAELEATLQPDGPLLSQYANELAAEQAEPLMAELTKAQAVVYGDIAGPNSPYYTERQASEDELFNAKMIMDHVDGDTTRRHFELSNRQRQLDKEHRITLSPDRPEAQRLLATMTPGIGAQMVMKRHAPEAIRSMPEGEAVAQLQRLVFSERGRLIDQSVTGAQVCIQGDEPLEVPSNLMSYVEGFQSWAGRDFDGSAPMTIKRPEGTSFQGTSNEAIRYYAGLDSEIPPASEVYLCMQPDGRVFGYNGSGDSHRIAAAMLRGQDTIRADRVIVQVLDQNVL